MIFYSDKNVYEAALERFRYIFREFYGNSVDGMVNIVFNMLRDGVSEREICEKVGLEQKELVKLKYVTGFAKIFKNYKYNAAIESR